MRSVWRAAVSRAAAGWRTLRHGWRRSLQVRMVTITLVTSSLLVGVFGYLVAERSTESLLDQTAKDLETRVRGGASYATGQLYVHSDPQDADLDGTLRSTLSVLNQGETIVLIKSQKFDDVIKPRAVPNLPAERAVTPQLERAVATEGQRAHQIVTRELLPGQPEKYLVYGAPVQAPFGQLELYYLVPLNTENSIANDIRRTVLLTGFALVLLLALLAALVTRLVVNPVRAAARTAQRLSAGLLDQRMTVAGEDDLALLAASFNQMAANLQRQIVRLEEMSRLQRRFTSDVSHELRTPLTTVRMAADLLFAGREEFEPAAARSAELLQAELDRFESLLTDLLEISRFDAGFAMLDAEPTDLTPIVRRVVDRLDGLAERAGIELRLDVPDSPVIAEADPRRVERILRNLIGNAVEHGEGRPVDVMLRADDGAAAITVRDHGVGLQPGEEKLVFNRFWRADPSRARQTGGTGLGLSISVEDARLHGGWLEAWGAPGQGAQFRLTLPMRAGDRLVASPLPLVPAGVEFGVIRALPAAPATAEPGARAVPDAAGTGAPAAPVGGGIGAQAVADAAGPGAPAARVGRGARAGRRPTAGPNGASPAAPSARPGTSGGAGPAAGNGAPGAAADAEPDDAVRADETVSAGDAAGPAEQPAVPR